MTKESAYQRRNVEQLVHLENAMQMKNLWNAKAHVNQPATCHKLKWHVLLFAYQLDANAKVVLSGMPMDNVYCNQNAQNLRSSAKKMRDGPMIHVWFHAYANSLNVPTTHNECAKPPVKLEVVFANQVSTEIWVEIAFQRQFAIDKVVKVVPLVEVLEHLAQILVIHPVAKGKSAKKYS